MDKMNDLISRASARDVINTWGRHENENVRMDLLHKDLNAVPSVDAIPVAWLREWQDEVGTINEWWPIIERIITVWHEEQEVR